MVVRVGSGENIGAGSVAFVSGFSFCWGERSGLGPFDWAALCGKKKYKL